MPDRPHHTKFIEGIEACRPGSRDLEMPEMSDVARLVADDAAARRLYDEVQRSDALVAAALRDGPVPAGLQERLLGALDEIENGSADAAYHALDVAPCASASRRAGRRRAMRVLSIVACVLVAVGLAAAYWLAPGEPLTVERVLDGAAASLDAVSAEAWNSALEAEPPQTHRVSRRVLVAPSDWQTISGLGDRQAVAYRFGDRGATLMVFRPRTKVTGLPAVPPVTPQDAVSGMVKAAWQENGLVYVLVLQGPAARQDYRRLVDAPGLAGCWRPQSLPNPQNA